MRIGRRKKVVNYVVLLLIFCFAFIGNSLLYAAMVEDKIWSFEFNNLSITDALNKISKVSGVEIVLNGNINKRPINKSYRNYTIDRILIDIFYGENFTALFHYSEQGLTFVNIRVLPKANSASGKIRKYEPIQHRNISQVTTTLQPQRDGTVQEASAKDIKKPSDSMVENSSYFTTFEEKDSPNSEIEAEKYTSYSTVKGGEGCVAFLKELNLKRLKGLTSD